MVPADDQAMALPWTSVMVIIVLLNVAFTWATPEAMFLRSRRRTRVASLPLHDPFAAPRPRHGPALCNALSDFLLAGDRLCRAFACARIGMGALAAHRQPAAVPQPTVAAKVHQPLDVHCDLTSQITLDEIVA